MIDKMQIYLRKGNRYFFRDINSSFKIIAEINEDLDVKTGYKHGDIVQTTLEIV